MPEIKAFSHFFTTAAIHDQTTVRKSHIGLHYTAQVSKAGSVSMSSQRLIDHSILSRQDQKKLYKKLRFAPSLSFFL